MNYEFRAASWKQRQDPYQAPTVARSGLLRVQDCENSTSFTNYPVSGALLQQK